MKSDIVDMIDNFDYSQNYEIARYEYYKYDDIDRNVVYDAIMWMKDGGDIYDLDNLNKSAMFSGLSFDEIQCLVHYKTAFFEGEFDEVSRSIYSKIVSAIGKAVELYGKSAPPILYRGIMDEELDYIKSSFKKKKVVAFDRIKSFSTDNVAVYDFGDNLMTLVTSGKKVLDYNSFLISIGIARLLLNKCDEDDVLLFMDGYDSSEMDEYIVPSETKFKVVDIDELKFKLV